MNALLQTGAIAVAVFLVAAAVDRYRLRKFWRRRCTARKWRRSFPKAQKVEIRLFLSLLVRSFALSESKRLCFAPEDQILLIYRALYPHPDVVADSMELENFVASIHEHFGVDLLSVWREDITLGELFAHATRAVAS